MATKNGSSPRTKNIALKYHHFKYTVKKGWSKIEYISTDMQKYDILTKPLSDALFLPLRHMLCGWEWIDYFIICYSF